TSTLDLRGVLDLLLEKIDMLLPYSAATVRLLNRESGELELVACRNLDGKEWRAEQWKDGHGIPNVMFESKALWMVSNMQTDPRTRDPEFFRKNGLVSYLGVPLIAKGGVLGVLGFYTKEQYQFANEEVEFLTTLASQTATAIQNSWFYEETKASKREVEKALQVKSAFLDTMSHELRTPLNVIIGNASIIKDQLCGSINSEQERRLSTIERSTADLLQMIKGILDISCLEKGVMPLHLEEINIGGLLSEIRSEFLDFSQKKGVRLEVHGNGLSGPMLSDRMKLKEILHNLVGNAVKFTGEGKVEIKVHYLSEGDRIEFGVQDTGIGIKEEELSHIFDVFYQVDSSSQREFGGTGIGLNIVKKLVELLQGEIRQGLDFPCRIAPRDFHIP
ncbi:MAG: ATP-binding protein, partial [Thermodesulfobacteriota bacterium]